MMKLFSLKVTVLYETIWIEDAGSPPIHWLESPLNSPL